MWEEWKQQYSGNFIWPRGTSENIKSIKLGVKGGCEGWD